MHMHNSGWFPITLALISSLLFMVFGVQTFNVALVIFASIVLFWSIGFLMYYIAYRFMANQTPFPEEDDDYDDEDDWDGEAWKCGIKKYED